MNLTRFSLKEYCELLVAGNCLAGPLTDCPELDRTVELVSYDSQNVIPGTLFLCKGAHFKAEYLKDAAARGAFAYVSERVYSEVDLPCIQVKNMRQVIAPLAIKYYNDPAAKLNVVGITGTKGKSSTTYFLRHILDRWLTKTQDSRCGVITSIRTYDGVEDFESRMTTPEPLELQKHFANALESDLGYVAMEVSSQALKYHRTLGTEFAVACFLNIGYDHISPIEHPDFEDYFRSKLKIFSQARVSCVNLDCDHADEVLAAAKSGGGKVITFSHRNANADLYASHIRKAGNTILFRVDGMNVSGEYRLSTPGLFNVENALAAIAVSAVLEVPREYIVEGLWNTSIPGRMEINASEDGNVVTIVDYAHNGMSFETLFHSVRTEYPEHRIVAVFGCPGMKAFDRRRDMGTVAGKSADFVVLTEDDSGEEDTASICREIASYVACPYRIELNRSEAIRQAILGCKEPTVVVIAGKGPETHQKRGMAFVETPSDAQYAEAFLREYNAGRRLYDVTE